jgi:DNA-binding transcriptional regulator GbsR (MarR family)
MMPAMNKMAKTSKSSKSKVPANGFTSAVARLEDGVAGICRLYGINPMLGRVYAVLFASPEALSLGELCQRVGAAKSTISVVLRRLLSLRIVRRQARRSDRRDFYEVVSDLWAVLRDWNQSYFQPEMAMWQRSSADLAGALDAADAPVGAGRRILQDRLETLDEVISLLAQVLGTFPGDASGTRGNAGAGRQAVSIAIEEDDA